MSIIATKWSFLVVVLCAAVWPPFIPCPLLPLPLESLLLEVTDLWFTLLGFPKHASLKDSSPELSEPFPISMFHLCVDSPHSCVQPGKDEQNHIRSSYFVLHKFSLESISYSPRYKVFQILSFKKFVYQISFSGIRSFAWNRSFYITHSCFFLHWAAFPILVNASGHMWSGRDVVRILVSLPPGLLISFRRVSFNNINLVKLVRVIKISFAFSLLKYIFMHLFLTSSITSFMVLQCKWSEYLFPKFHQRIKHNQ